MLDPWRNGPAFRQRHELNLPASTAFRCPCRGGETSGWLKRKITSMSVCRQEQHEVSKLIDGRPCSSARNARAVHGLSGKRTEPLVISRDGVPTPQEIARDRFLVSVRTTPSASIGRLNLTSAQTRARTTDVRRKSKSCCRPDGLRQDDARAELARMLDVPLQGRATTSRTRTPSPLRRSPPRCRRGSEALADRCYGRRPWPGSRECDSTALTAGTTDYDVVPSSTARSARSQRRATAIPIPSRPRSTGR